ncbi:MAG: flagellar biosynthetic protein FliR [Oscillospiraceae bacterium]|nr:flagellar biosynthetic protein FliR [Oscillospiraceae bacterium]
MGTMINAILGSADYFVLLLFRVGGLITASPIFGRLNIPALAKIGFVAAVTYLFFIIFPQTAELGYTTLVGFALVCASELLLGIALAFVTNLFFSITSFTAGQLIDMQIGFGIVNVYDMQNNTQIPMMGNILNIMLLIIFFTVNGHLRLIDMVSLTIESIPIGTLAISPNMGIVALEIFTRAFLLGVMMALPILASGLTLEIAFGVMMRAVPQIHMFVVGIPLKMLAGLAVFSFTVPVFARFSSRIFTEMFNSIGNMFATFNGA